VKWVERVLMAFMALVPLFLVGLMVVGLVIALFDKPQSVMKMALYIAGVAGVVYGAMFLLTNKYTAFPAKLILSIGILILVVTSCETSSVRCTPSRFVDCY